jgi:hypothetical protein
MRRLFGPPQVQVRERFDALDRFIHVPPLIRVDHQLPIRPYRGAHGGHTPEIILWPAADLHLEMRPAVRQRLLTEPMDLCVGVPQPADGCRVCRIALRQKLRLTRRFCGRLALEN